MMYEADEPRHVAEAERPAETQPRDVERRIQADAGWASMEIAAQSDAAEHARSDDAHSQDEVEWPSDAATVDQRADVPAGSSIALPENPSLDETSAGPAWITDTKQNEDRQAPMDEALQAARATEDEAARLDEVNREAVERAQQGETRLADQVPTDDVARPAQLDEAADLPDDDRPTSRAPSLAEARENVVREYRIAEARAAVDDAFMGDAPESLASDDRDLRPVDAEAVARRTGPNRIDLADDVHAMELKPTFDGYLDLVIHGDPTHTQADIVGDRIDFDLPATATLIRDSPAWQDRPIRLLSCSVGRDTFAQDLADDLKVPVYAPDDVLAVFGDGTTTVENGGRWHRFEPHWYR